MTDKKKSKNEWFAFGIDSQTQKAMYIVRETQSLLKLALSEESDSFEPITVVRGKEFKIKTKKSFQFEMGVEKKRAKQDDLFPVNESNHPSPLLDA